MDSFFNSCKKYLDIACVIPNDALKIAQSTHDFRTRILVHEARNTSFMGPFSFREVFRQICWKITPNKTK